MKKGDGSRVPFSISICRQAREGVLLELVQCAVKPGKSKLGLRMPGVLAAGLDVERDERVCIQLPGSI